MALQHLRSSTANKRPVPGNMSEGQLAINSASGSPGLFFKDSNANLVKVGPVHVGTTAPNASPASGGTAGNSVGEQWLDTSGSNPVFKVWDGSAWQSQSGEFVNASGDVMTGALGIIAGSQGSPGLYFSGDTNTGIYSPGADQVAISTNGTQKIVVDANGNVGIGGNGTGNNLGVYLQKGGGVPAHFYEASDGTKTMIAGADSSLDYVKIGALSNHPVGIVTNNGEKVRITTDGKLGLGTSSVSAKLHITSSSGGDDSGLRITRSDTGGGDWRIWSTADANGEGGGKLIFGNTANRVTIDSQGRLGIGSTTPHALLDIGGSAAFNAGTYQSPKLAVSNGYISIKSDAADGVSRLTLIGDSGTGDGTIDWGGNSSTNLKFTNNGDERARITSSGQLLVGTTSSVSSAANAAVEVIGAGSQGGELALGRNDTSIVADNSIGIISFWGNDSDSLYDECASITAFADGTHGDDSKPTRLVFSTTADGAASPTERMRISNGGEISMGSASINDLKVLELTTGQLSTGSGVLVCGTANNNTNGRYIEFKASGNIVIGSITQSSASSTAYNTSSDYRLKENIVPLTGAVDRLNQLQVHRFNFIADPDKTVDGFLAHETQAVVPECVTGTKDEVDADGNPVYQGIDQSKLVPLLTAALQEALAEIESLKARLDAANL